MSGFRLPRAGLARSHTPFPQYHTRGSKKGFGRELNQYLYKFMEILCVSGPRELAKMKPPIPPPHNNFGLLLPVPV